MNFLYWLPLNNILWYLPDNGSELPPLLVEFIPHEILLYFVHLVLLHSLELDDCLLIEVDSFLGRLQKCLGEPDHGFGRPLLEILLDSRLEDTLL